MLLQSESPAYTYKYHVDLNISILANGNEYEAIIFASGIRPQIFPINLTHHQVDELNEALKQAIEEVRRNCEEDGVSDDILSSLANTGKYAFNTIFENGASTLYQVLKLFHTEKPTTIEIATRDFFLPWELLYDGPLDRVEVSHFWGIRHILSRTIMQKERPGAMVSPLLQSSRPKVGLITCNENALEFVVSREIPMLQELGRQGLIFLFPLRPLNAEQRHKELEYFIHFFGEELQIAHLACHAFEQKPDSQSYLDIANDFHITIEDFRARNLVVKYNPLVILNACLTGMIDSLHISGWASEFWKGGARGVVATEFQVPDWFAATFVEKFYEHLLSGVPLGESIWATRSYFWEQHRNPLGLAYALYAPLAIRIVK